jgi:adenine-specific DNA-methyltransferase
VVAETDYAATFKHLTKYQQQLETRLDKGEHWSNLRNCAYLAELDKPKIIWGELSDKAKFTFDDEGHYLNNTIFFLTGKNLKYLLSILNSKVAKWYFEKISTSSGMGTNRWLKYKVEQLPIRPLSENLQTPFIEKVNQILTLKKADSKADTSELEVQIDRMVYELYELTEEEILIVEGK